MLKTIATVALVTLVVPAYGAENLDSAKKALMGSECTSISELHKQFDLSLEIKPKGQSLSGSPVILMTCHCVNGHWDCS